MARRNIDCYLCEERAMEQDSLVLTNIIVNCKRCKRYELTFKTLRIYFETGILNDDHKKQLSRYIQDNYDPKTKEPILLDINKIKEITDVESVNKRYK